VINPGPYATSAELINPARKLAQAAKRRKSARARGRKQRRLYRLGFVGPCQPLAVKRAIRYCERMGMTFGVEFGWKNAREIASDIRRHGLRAHLRSRNLKLSSPSAQGSRT